MGAKVQDRGGSAFKPPSDNGSYDKHALYAGYPLTRSRREQAAWRQAKAAGRKEALPPERKAVTAATNELATRRLTPPREGCNPQTIGDSPHQSDPRVWVDFAHVRSQVTIGDVLSKLGVLSQMQGRGVQKRGPCPIHGDHGNVGRSFSVHLSKNVFRCLHVACAKQGNALDLWAAARDLPLRDAAIDLAETFHLELAPRPRSDSERK